MKTTVGRVTIDVDLLTAKVTYVGEGLAFEIGRARFDSYIASMGRTFAKMAPSHKASVLAANAERFAALANDDAASFANHFDSMGEA